MTVLNEGLNKIRDLLESNLTKGQSGTGTTLPTASDSGLETPVAATLLTLTSITKNDKQLTTTHDINANVGNGNNISEHEIQFSDGVSLHRVVHASFSKTSANEMQYLDTFFLES